MLVGTFPSVYEDKQQLLQCQWFNFLVNKSFWAVEMYDNVRYWTQSVRF